MRKQIPKIQSKFYQATQRGLIEPRETYEIQTPQLMFYQLDLQMSLTNVGRNSFP